MSGDRILLQLCKSVSLKGQIERGLTVPWSREYVGFCLDIPGWGPVVKGNPASVRLLPHNPDILDTQAIALAPLSAPFPTHHRPKMFAPFTLRTKLLLGLFAWLPVLALEISPALKDSIQRLLPLRIVLCGAY